MHSYGTAALDHAQPADTHRQQSTICLQELGQSPILSGAAPTTAHPTTCNLGKLSGWAAQCLRQTG